MKLGRGSQPPGRTQTSLNGIIKFLWVYELHLELTLTATLDLPLQAHS